MGDSHRRETDRTTPDGIARCYWWQHLEDEMGGLTDQPLDPDGGGYGQLTVTLSMSSGQRLAVGAQRLVPPALTEQAVPPRRSA